MPIPVEGVDRFMLVLCDDSDIYVQLRVEEHNTGVAVCTGTVQRCPYNVEFLVPRLEYCPLVWDL